MRIAYLSNGNPDSPTFDQLFLRTMVERGHEPHFISCWPVKADYSYLGVNWSHIYPPTGRLRRVRLIFNLRRLLKQIQPDVLHTGWVQTAGFYGALSGFHPMLLMPWGHDILPHLDEQGYSESLQYRISTHLAIKSADRITCDCELVKRRIVEMTRYPAAKIVVFPWGVDRHLFRPRSGHSDIRNRLGWEDNRVIIMNRLFTPRRGVQHFIKAVPDIVSSLPQARIMMIGDGPLYTELRHLVKDLEIEKYVRFLGRVPNDKMPDYLHAADVYVTTSLSDGTSVSLIEALACGLPVVVTDAPAYLEWVVDGVNGFIVPRCNTEMLAERVVALLSDTSLQQRMGQRNIEIAQRRLDWEQNFDLLETLYDELIETGRRRTRPKTRTGIVLS